MIDSECILNSQWMECITTVIDKLRLNFTRDRLQYMRLTRIPQAVKQAKELKPIHTLMQLNNQLWFLGTQQPRHTC